MLGMEASIVAKLQISKARFVLRLAKAHTRRRATHYHGLVGYVESRVGMNMSRKDQLEACDTLDARSSDE